MSFWFDVWGFIRQDIRNITTRSRTPISYKTVCTLLTALFFVTTVVSLTAIPIAAAGMNNPLILLLAVPAGLFVVFVARFTKWYGDKHNEHTIWDGRYY